MCLQIKDLGLCKTDSPRQVGPGPIVLDPGKVVCADPVKRGAILDGEGPGPPSGDNERQLSPDRRSGKT
jgi:hypothetical protein